MAPKITPRPTVRGASANLTAISANPTPQLEPHLGSESNYIFGRVKHRIAPLTCATLALLSAHCGANVTVDASDEGTDPNLGCVTMVNTQPDPFNYKGGDKSVVLGGFVLANNCPDAHQLLKGFDVYFVAGKPNGRNLSLTVGKQTYTDDQSELLPGENHTRSWLPYQSLPSGPTSIAIRGDILSTDCTGGFNTISTPWIIWNGSPLQESYIPPSTDNMGHDAVVNVTCP